MPKPFLTASLIALIAFPVVAPASSPTPPVTAPNKSVITIVSSPTTANLGDTVTFTALVLPSGTVTSPTPSGTVTFMLTTITATSTGNVPTTTQLGTSIVNGSGVATFTTNLLPLSPVPAFPAGKSVSNNFLPTPPFTPFQVNATYSGDAVFQASATSVFAPETITPQFDLYVLTASPTTGSVAGSNEGTYTSSGSTTTFASLGTVTVKSGQPVQLQGTLEGNNGYSTPVVFSCQNLPQSSSCSFSQSSLAPTPFGAPFNISLSTSHLSGASTPFPSPFGPGRSDLIVSAALVGIGCSLRRKRLANLLRARGGALLLALGTLLAASAASGCGGSAATPVNSPAGSSVVLVTGASATSTFNVAFTLVIQ